MPNRKLEQDFKLMSSALQSCADQKDEAVKKLWKLESENARLREALEFYAKEGSYIFDEPDDDTEQLDLNKLWRHTSGKKAREALKQEEPEEE